ncbi:MAG: cupin domain-containing protein [Candidatus Dormibacteria bacterium]
MRRYSPPHPGAKGWLCGPWNSRLQLSIGYANQGVDEPHLHSRIHEVYLVLSGSAIAVVDDREILLGEGDVLVVEPGEGHTFISSSPDYFHFVLHTPTPTEGDKHPVTPTPLD